ncbi:thiamine phosphate synthase, partial [Campylobacter jejuni]
MGGKKISAMIDRKCVHINFLERNEKRAKAKVEAIVLRGKDLSEFEYYDLGKEVLSICAKEKVTVFLLVFDTECVKFGHRYFHAPLSSLITEPKVAIDVQILGTSVQSKEVVGGAMGYKVKSAVVGHIFESACKMGLEPK